MSSPIRAARDLRESPFPLEPAFGLPWRAWHEHYPRDVPRGLIYPPLRLERVLELVAARYPDRDAIWYYHTTWTYTELMDRVRQVAANFRRLGVEAGDRILLALPNSPEFVVAWFAAAWLGAQVVPANPLCSGADLIRLAKLTKPRAVIAMDVRLEPIVELTRQYAVPLLFLIGLAQHLPLRWSIPYRIKAWLEKKHKPAPTTAVHGFDILYRHDCPPIEQPALTDCSLPAVLQPTGGTTGTPKLAVLTHKNLLANVSQLHVWSGLKPGEEVVFGVLPFFHVFGTTVALLSSLAGGATLLLQARFHLPSVWRIMEKMKPTVAPMVPMMFAALRDEMVRRNKTIRGLRICLSGASALDADVRQAFQDLTGAVIFEGYGLSEASPVTHSNPPDDTARPGTIGLPLPDTQAKIMDAETGTRELPPGEIGELVVTGPQIMAGYLDAPAETAHVLRDGWLFTGDLGHMDAAGFFTVVDRKKDMIKSGGLCIYPSEVERVIASHASIRECAVVGVPDKLFGQKLVCYVVPSNGTPVVPEVIKAHCRRELSAYKIPRIIEVCDKLPTTFLGKVRRVELRDLAAATQASSGSSLTLPPAPTPSPHDRSRHAA